MSLAQFLAALLVLGPHSDVPGQPVASFVVMAVALAGFALVRALWRRRASAARGLPLWGAGMLLFVLTVMLIMPSPAERLGAAWPAIATGGALWGLFVWQATRYVQRRTRSAP